MRQTNEPSGRWRGALPPFTRGGLGDLLTRQAAARPTQEALVWRPAEGPRQAWSYAELLDAADRFAGGLRERGIKPGARVCVHLDNCPEFIVAWFALARLGCPMVASNTKSAPAELTYFLERSAAAALVTSAAEWPSVEPALPDGIELVVVVDARGSSGRAVPFEAVDAPFGAPVPVDPLDVAGIQFTSGTTSRPKGVVWTHANYLWGGKVSARNERLLPGDRHLTYLPLFHTNAQIYSVLASLWVGGTVVLMPKFSSRRFWDVAVEEGTTYASMIPFAVRALKDQPVPEHSFRGWAMGLLFPRWEQHFGLEITGFFGMTETVAQPIVSDPTVPSRPGAIGFPAPEYGVRVVGDDGMPVTTGEGLLEILGVPGLSLALEYLDDPEATSQAYTADGWFKTGDRVRVHEDGCLTYLEREKDMLKVGGENVATSEVERVISTIPGINEVAVVGRPDRMLDEVPVAFVVIDDAAGLGGDIAARVLAECEAQLASFKVPRDVIVLDALPRAALEKISKATLRELATRPVAADVGPT